MGKYYVLALRAAADITGTIFIPALLAAFAGRRLDAHYDSGKTFFALLLILAFILTIVILIRKVRSYGRAYQKLTSEPSDGAASS